MSQDYKKLLTDYNLPKSFSGFLVLSLSSSDLVVYCKCGESKTHIKLSFENVCAYMVHEEFSHPEMDRGSDVVKPPKSESGNSYHAALEVTDSEWKASYPDHRLQFRTESVKHHRFLSYSNIIDVLFFGLLRTVSATSQELQEIERSIEVARV